MCVGAGPGSVNVGRGLHPWTQADSLSAEAHTGTFAVRVTGTAAAPAPALAGPAFDPATSSASRSSARCRRFRQVSYRERTPGSGPAPCPSSALSS